jgi:hypothetical protein
MIQRCAHNAQVFATGDRDDDALTLAFEQLDAKLNFERLDALADGALRDTEFLGGRSNRPEIRSVAASVVRASAMP